MSDKNGRGSRGINTAAVVLSLLAIITLASSVLLSVFSDYDRLAITVYALAFYIIVSAVFLIVGVIRSVLSRGRLLEIKSSVFGKITLDFILKLYMPVVICDDKGKIIWYNTALSSKFRSRGALFGKYIDNICDATIERIVKDNDGDGTEVSFISAIDAESNNTVYRAKGYMVSAHSKNYYMTVFLDVTEIRDLNTKLSEEDTVIAYAVIDNLEELMQYVQGFYDTAANDVGSILKKNMDKVGGVLREYSKNKYICVFAAKYLPEFEEDRFSMLDEVRGVCVGETPVPVTISMGVSKIKGTLSEKERTAQEALNLALQRGGDQVVVKNADGVDYYGGKTKTVQKRTKVRSRVIANEFTALLKKSTNVIVMGHKFADFDAFASCIAVARIASFCGVRVNIVADMQDRNLASCFARLSGEPEYSALFVDKTGAQDLIMSDTLAVVVDVNNLAFCEAPDVVSNVNNVVIIDHHRKTGEYRIRPNIVYIEPSASSASELLSEFLEHVLPQGALPKVEADMLFAGLLLDTKRFTHNTGVRTFSAALYLRGEGASPLDAETLFKTGIKDFLSVAKFESNVVIYKSVIAIALNDSENNSPLVRVSAAKAADRLLSVDGVQAAFALCKIDDTVHISARSLGNINVQLILEKMGGGGHFDSAGAQIKNSSAANALTTLRAAIDEYLSENL